MEQLGNKNRSVQSQTRFVPVDEGSYMMWEPDVMIQEVIFSPEFLRGWSNIGTERLQSLHPWWYSKPDCRWPWATCSHWLCFESGVGQDGLQRCLPTWAILWFCGEIHNPVTVKQVSRSFSSVFIFRFALYVQIHFYSPPVLILKLYITYISSLQEWDVTGTKGGLLFWSLRSARFNAFF